MKANEAPKKLYVVDVTFPDYVDFDGSPINTKRIDDHDIEYTRTDVFIEKTCAWLENNLQGIVGGSIYIEDFRKYMRGE